VYEVLSKIFRTHAVKIIKLTIRPVGRHHPRSSSLQHVDTGPTVSIFGTLAGGNLFGNRKKSQGVKSGEYNGWGMTAIFISPETAGWGRKCETGCCHGEAARSVLNTVRGDVFSRFHVFAAKLRSRNRNSQFGLLVQIFCATTTAV
jgi:hypothetical protein